MSLILLHGDHIEQSRNRLAELMEEFRTKGLEIFRFDPQASTIDELRSLLNTQLLFGSSSAVIVENLFTLKSLKKKKEYIALLTEGEYSVDVVMWDGKTLTATQLKPFSKAKVENFKLSQTLFQLMDSLGGDVRKSVQLYDQTLQTESADFVFQMMIRQVRLLLATSLGANLKEHPFVLQKIRKQVRLFTTQQLQQLHEKLTLLDFHQKTGQIKLPFAQELANILMRV